MVDTQVYDAAGAFATWEAGQSLANQSSSSAAGRNNSFDSNAETLVLGAGLDQGQELPEVPEVVHMGLGDPSATEAAIGEGMDAGLSERMADDPEAEMLQADDHGMIEPTNVPEALEPMEVHETELPESVDPGTIEVHEAEHMNEDPPAGKAFSVLDFKALSVYMVV